MSKPTRPKATTTTRITIKLRFKGAFPDDAVLSQGNLSFYMDSPRIEITLLLSEITITKVL